MNAKMKLIIPVFIVVAFAAMSFNNRTVKHSYKNDCIRYLHFTAADIEDILVGNRTSDSTGTMTISTSDIQQLILPAISYLDGMSLNSASSSLMVTPVAAYIILNGADGSGSTVTVAIQLLCNDSTFIYRPHSKTMVHVCKRTSDCGSCQFVMLGNIIYNCRCGSQSADSTTQACQDSSYLLK
jgi:hypothetical protein